MSCHMHRLTSSDTVCVWCAVYGTYVGCVCRIVWVWCVYGVYVCGIVCVPVFNVADCFITCGCIAMMASLILFNKEFWKDEKKK